MSRVFAAVALRWPWFRYGPVVHWGGIFTCRKASLADLNTFLWRRVENVVELPNLSVEAMILNLKIYNEN